MKMSFLTLIGLLMGFVFTINAQQNIQLYDENTWQPIEGVLVKVDQMGDLKIQVLVSDDKGRVSIQEVSSTTLISISHPDYKKLNVQYSFIQERNFKIGLKSNANTFDETVISASKVEEKKKDVAQKIQVLKSSELQFQNQSSIADAMAGSGNVFVQKSQLGGGSPIIRGFETNKVLMVVDGIRMNNAIYRGGHLQNIITLDNSMMDRVEVVFGPGSVVYGSDAIGGVMSFTTKNPTLSSTDDVLVKGGAYTRYFSAANGFAANANVSVGSKRFASLTSFTYSRYGDLRQGAIRSPFVGNFGSRPWYVERINGVDSMIVNPDTNLQVGSGYTQYDILQKFTFKQNNWISHKLNFQLSNSSNIDRYDRLTLMSNGKPRFAEWYYGPQFRLQASYTLEFSNKNKFYDNARLILGYQSIEESRMDRRFNKDLLNNRIENLDVVTFNADFSKKIAKHELRYGLDAYVNLVKSKAFVKDIVADTTGSLDTRYPDGGSSMKAIAGYLTHTWELSDKMILNDGLRFSNVGLNAIFNDKSFFPFPFDTINQNYSALNGNIGVIYIPTSNLRITATGSTGFRAPNVDDLTKVFESIPGKVVVPNPNLRSEYSYSAEIGINYRIAKSINLGANAYYTLLNNALTVQNSSYAGQDSIVYDGVMSQVMTTTNTGRAFVYGFEGFVSGEIGEYFSIIGTVNYTYGRIKTDTIPYPLDHIPPVFGKFGITYHVDKFKTELFANYSGWKRLKDYNLIGEDNFAYALPEGMPSWFTLNIRAGYNFNKTVSVQVACENILDQNYRNFASNISAPGRNFILTLRGNF
jgi:hemoglobin/transferrin/lactoferrin receptor protein